MAISMEFAQGGDLFAYTLGPNSFGKLAEVQARWIFQQLILGLDYCHRKVHTSCLNLYGKLAEVQAGWVFQQLILGLDYCHRKVYIANTHGCMPLAARDMHGRVLMSSRCRSDMLRGECPCHRESCSMVSVIATGSHALQ